MLQDLPGTYRIGIDPIFQELGLGVFLHLSAQVRTDIGLVELEAFQ